MDIPKKRVHWRDDVNDPQIKRFCVMCDVEMTAIQCIKCNDFICTACLRGAQECSFCWNKQVT